MALSTNPVTASEGKGPERVIVAVLIIVIVLIVCGAWWYWHRPVTPTPAAATACATSDLQVSMGTSEGTAGTIYRHLVLTNNGSRTCLLGGYPAAFLLDSHGATLGFGAASNALYMPVVITLAHGQSAHAVLGLPDAGNFAPNVCGGPATTLRVYPPGSITAIDIASTEKSCPGFSITALQSGA